MANQIEFRVSSEDGLHARPASVIAKVAAQFKSEIEIVSKDQTKNAKSVLSIMSLGLQQNDTVTLRARGDDSESALAALQNLINQDFKI